MQISSIQKFVNSNAKILNSKYLVLSRQPLFFHLIQYWLKARPTDGWSKVMRELILSPVVVAGVKELRV
jgi:hypothetical protein